MMPKTVILLIGPKGAGKSHIGSVLGRETGIRFLRVEPIWLMHQGEAYSAVVDVITREVEALFAQADVVVLESLGL